MLCTKCKTNIASFFYTQSINGNESSVALCKSCAENNGIDTSTVSPLFSSFFGNTSKNVRDIPRQDKKCSLCALTFNDILSMGKVGCPECYNTFKNELSNTIHSIHGMAKHAGLTPCEATKVKTQTKKPSEEEILRDKLNEAIQAENYEEAANLRDRIKALKGEN
ncbi:MAG: UvrB/UvrC motif-containing protein [Clostridia bacterium]|nr:UvrB/UvrC motif-containing protein [Clostridia bacterium]